MFHPAIEDFFAAKEQQRPQNLRLLLFLDIDGVVRLRKGPVPQEITRIVYDLSRKYRVKVILITGAPADHLPAELLPPALPLYRAFAESGAVERLANGILRPHQTMVGKFRQLESYLDIHVDDGLVHIPALEKTIIREGKRLTSFTAIMGNFYPPRPRVQPTATHEQVRFWLTDCIETYRLPFVLMEGREETYSYIDVIHQNIGKEWRVERILRRVHHDVAFYIGDGAGDEAAMALAGIVPIALANSTARIKTDAAKRGFRVEKSGPDGTYEFLSALIAFFEERA